MPEAQPPWLWHRAPSLDADVYGAPVVVIVEDQRHHPVNDVGGEVRVPQEPWRDLAREELLGIPTSSQLGGYRVLGENYLKVMLEGVV